VATRDPKPSVLWALVQVSANDGVVLDPFARRHDRHRRVACDRRLGDSRSPGHPVERRSVVDPGRADVVEVMQPFVRGLPHHPQDGAAFPREPDGAAAPLRFADLAHEGGEPVSVPFEVQQYGGQRLLVVGALCGALVVAHRLERGLVLGQRAANPGLVDVVDVADMAGVLQRRPHRGRGPPTQDVDGQVLQPAAVLRGMAADQPEGRRWGQVAVSQTARFAVVVLLRQRRERHRTTTPRSRPVNVPAGPLEARVARRQDAERPSDLTTWISADLQELLT